MIHVILRKMVKFPLNIHKTQRSKFIFFFTLKSWHHPTICFYVEPIEKQNQQYFCLFEGRLPYLRGICSVSREKSGMKLVQKISTSLIKLLFSSNLFVCTCKIYIFSLLYRVDHEIFFQGQPTNLKLEGIIQFFELCESW